MTVTYFALGATFAAIAAGAFARAKRAGDGKAERQGNLAGALFMVAAVAFIVAGALGMATGR